MQKGSKIFIAGHRGLVGSAVHNTLKQRGYCNLLLRTSKELDLTCQQAVLEFFKNEQPEYVFLAAAKVGGIVANNTYRGDFILKNLQIQTNVLEAALASKVKKLLFLGSSCIYPAHAPQPIKENYLLTNELEYTNEPYAIAKIAGIKLCESLNVQYGTNFIAAMPTNLYGPNDNFNLETSHVLPALLRKILLGSYLESNNWVAIKEDLTKRPIEQITGTADTQAILTVLAKYGIQQNQKQETSIEIWGTGTPLREFLWSEDLADACVYLMETVNFKQLIDPNSNMVRNTHVNIGSGEEISIANLASLIKQLVNFKGILYFNTSKPDGTPRKLCDVSKLHQLGWHHKTNLENGIAQLLSWYLKN